MEQKRFLLALVLSFAILFGWNYFFRPNAPPQDNTNVAPPPITTQSETPQALTASTQPSPAESAAPAQEDAPQRLLTIDGPLYRVRLDSRGAVPTSWVIKQNKVSTGESGRPIYSVAGNKDNPKELELISQEGLKKEPRDAPFALETGDKNLDSLLASRNYRVEGVEGDGGETRIELKSGEQPRRVSFITRDPSTGVELTKSIIFSPDSYTVDVSVSFAGGNQNRPNVKLAVGPSIGDQGVPFYTFYSVAPEGIHEVLNGDVQRIYASTVHSDEASPGRQVVNGPINWAGVGDTYFAMVAVPLRPADGLEYRTSKYEHDVDGTKEERFLITGLLSVPTDGTPTKVFVGTKDHYLLESASAELTKAVGQAGRTIDLDGLIDYGWGSTITRPLALPILAAIRWLNNLTGNYGVAIILFTILIYSLFFPLKWRTTKSMKKAQKLAPRMKELQAKIKELQSKGKGAKQEAQLKDLQMEQLRLMKEGNPLGGCLPLLIQMPFLFALFRAITISLDFRQASFLWMPDLSAADPIRVLPVLMAASMLVIQWITPAPQADPLQRKMMAVMLPVMMLYMMWSAPAGLLVYWFVGNLVTFGQQIVINRLIKSEDDQEPPEKGSEEKLKPKKLGQARASEA